MSYTLCNSLLTLIQSIDAMLSELVTVALNKRQTHIQNTCQSYFKSRLVNLNPQAGHIIHTDSTDGHVCVYDIHRKAQRKICLPCADIKVMSCSFQTFSLLIRCLIAVCRPIMLCLLNCVIEPIHGTESCISLPRGPYATRGQRFGQPWFK